MTVKDVRSRLSAWGLAHNGIVCALIAVTTFLLLVGLFLFVVFSDFGGSADFIYNQF